MIVGTAPRLRRDARLNGISVQVLASIRQEIKPDNWRFSFCSPFWRLYYHHSDGASIKFQGAKIPIPNGRAFLIPAHLEFFAETEVPLRQDYLHFEVFGFSPAIHCQLYPKPICISENSAISSLADQWSRSIRNSCGDPSTERMEEEREVNAGDIVEYFLAASLANFSLASISSEFDEGQRSVCAVHSGASNRIWPAVEKIESDLSVNHDLQILSESCHLSQAQFIRVFTAAMGMTPTKYKINRRLQVACQMLAKSESSIEKIASDLGFTDRSHFVRSFETQYTMSPTTYRKQFSYP